MNNINGRQYKSTDNKVYRTFHTGHHFRNHYACSVHFS